MTAPPAGALEACLALLEKATPGEWESHTTNITMVGLDLADPMKACGLLVASGSPDQAKNNADFVAAAVNFLRTHGPALLAALRLREWRPIESAPRDGTWVELAGGVVRYGWEGDQPPTVSGQYSADGDCWQFAWYDGGYYGEYEKPTHWRPLEPPTADDLARVLENER